MTLIGDAPLQAKGIVKAFGAVKALRGASLDVRSGEVHALLGANGAGKSTLVKILTGALRADAGTIVVHGHAQAMLTPAKARQAGIASVYQEPSLVPDLDVLDNVALTRTPLEPFRAWVSELGIQRLDLRAYARDLPLPELRILDFARALSFEPDLLLLDEITAALPADLTERVMHVVRRLRSGGTSVIFISHRLIEIQALCDRATVLRDGQTVGVVDVVQGSEETIVGLMLGPVGQQAAIMTDSKRDQKRVGPGRGDVRLAVHELNSGDKLRDVSFDLRAGEVLGLVALEGQGQDELFAILSGAQRWAAGELSVNGRPQRFAHPSDAIQAGVAYVPANRLEALLMQRSVRENIALPSVARPRFWGLIAMRAERARVQAAMKRLQVDTRAQSEVRRLSGGNQQKVTIARWIASRAHTLLCFDPTRGIDIGTKTQIYALLRELAAAGAAVLLYTSELDEIQLACDRVLVLFGGRIVDELPSARADESTLLRAAYGLPPGAVAPEVALAGSDGDAGAAG
jgi:ribose transport system ATP-binding protein